MRPNADRQRVSNGACSEKSGKDGVQNQAPGGASLESKMSLTRRVPERR